MDLKRIGQKGGRRFLSLIYISPIDQVATTLGIKPSLINIYGKLSDIQETREQNFTVGDTTITVQTKTINQYYRIEKYQGKERPVMKNLLDNLNESDVFYDVGAWFGIYSCLAGKSTNDVDVHAFEPSDYRFSILKNNIEINDVNATSHQYGLSSTDQTLYWLPGGKISNKETDEVVEKVPLVAGDEYIESEGIDPPTVMKIDVEGGELDVIRGLSGALSSNTCRLVYCELHPHLGVNKAEVEENLIELGFEIELMHSRDNTVFIKAYKTDLDQS